MGARSKGGEGQGEKENTPVPGGTRVQECKCFLCYARFGNIDFQCVIGQGIGIEHADRLICIYLRGHGHKSEAFRHASALVFDEFHRRDRSGLCEQGIDFILRGRLGQVSYVNSNIHFITAFSGRAGNKNDRNPISGSAAKGTTEIQLFITYSV